MKHYFFVELGGKCPQCIRQVAILYERSSHAVIEQCYECRRVWRDGISISDAGRKKVEAWRRATEGALV